MQALILLAHGSRNPTTAKEVADLAALIHSADTARRVTHAFLELARPALQEAVDQLVRDGAKVIDVLPLFLNAGNHVIRDIPQLVAEIRRQYPHLDLRLLRHIGSHPAYVELVEAIARDTGRYVVNA